MDSLDRVRNYLLFLFCVNSAVLAAEIRIDPATDIEEIVKRAGPGDTLVLPKGVYNDFRITFEAVGSPESPIVLRAESPGQVTFTGDSGVVITGKYLVVSGFVFDQAWNIERGNRKFQRNIVAFVGAKDCRLTDCVFIECGCPDSTACQIVMLRNGSQNNRVDHCYMRRNLSIGMGVRVGDGDGENTGSRFDHNYFHDIVNREANGQEAIQIGQGALAHLPMHTLVEFCLFDNANGDPEIISSKSSRNIFRYNTFRNCDQAELVLRGGSHALVESNFFFNGKGGIRLHGEHHMILNNYFENMRFAITASASDEGHAPADHCLLVHNTIVNSTYSGIRLGNPLVARVIDRETRVTPGVMPFQNTFVNNLIVGKTGVLVEDHGSRESTWKGNIVWPTGEATQGLEEAGLRPANPLLVQRDGIYRLPDATSPATDTAIPVEPFLDGRGVKIQDDIDGQPGNRNDVGCDEVSPVIGWRKPLKPEHVGPTWMSGDSTSLRRIDAPKPIPKISQAKPNR